MGWMRILLNFTNPPPFPRPPMQRMFKIWLSWPYVNLFLNISWRARKKKTTTQWKINDNLVKHEIFEINICYEHTMYFKTRVHECNWFDNLKCTVYISFNCQIDGITDKSNIANKWKSKPRLCAILLPIRLVTDWLHTYIGLTNLIDGEAKCFLICWPINYLPCRVWIINTYERTWRFVTLQIFFC